MIRSPIIIPDVYASEPSYTTHQNASDLLDRKRRGQFLRQLLDDDSQHPFTYLQRGCVTHLQFGKGGLDFECRQIGLGIGVNGLCLKRSPTLNGNVNPAGTLDHMMIGEEDGGIR